MKIAMDARWIFPEISGIGAYTLALIDQLAVLDGKNEYVLLFQDESVRDRTVAETRIARAANFRTQLLPWTVFSLSSQMFLPRFLATNGFDIFHSPNYMIPLFAFPADHRGRTRCVVTIHDVIPLAFPHLAPKARKNRLFPLFKWVMLQVGRRADAILTVSEASKRDIVQHLRLPAGAAGKVKVVYNGVSELFRPGAARQRPEPGARPERTILYVGRLDPYKNLAGLVRAFALVRKSASFPVRLVVAGSPDPRYPEALRTARELGVADAVVWTGYLPPPKLVSVYQQADVLAHPSRYEGFGLQILEAMACGLPVVCSNAASLPEVAGDAALLVDPDDVPGWAAKIAGVLTDPALAASLVEKGRRRAAEFTWARAAKEILALYETTVAARNAPGSSADAVKGSAEGMT